jgi:hypothetical protein
MGSMAFQNRKMNPYTLNPSNSRVGEEQKEKERCVSVFFRQTTGGLLG